MRLRGRKTDVEKAEERQRIEREAPVLNIFGGARRGSASRLRRNLFILLRIGLGLMLLTAAFYGVDLQALGDTVVALRFPWVALTLLAFFATFAFKAMRWRLLLPTDSGFWRWSDVVGSLLIGQAGSILLPFRAGSVLRAGSLAVEQSSRFPALMAGVVVEKALDVIMLTAAAVLVIPAISGVMTYSGLTGLILGAFIALFFAFSISISAARIWAFFRRMLQRIPAAFIEKWIVWGDQGAQALRSSLRDPRRLFGALTLSIVIWMLMFLTNLALFQAIELQVGYASGLVVLVLIHIGLLPNLMPGSIGPFYLATRLALSTTSTSPADALGFAVLLHAIVTLPPLAGAGLYLLLRQKSGQMNQ
jgi:uncharacterized membrane protein YbhN (UPF0104 family)